MACVKHLLCRFDYILNRYGADNYVNLYLRQQICLNLYTSVILGLALLNTAA